jgi:putative protease
MEEGRLIGKVSHYFDHIGVAAVEISDGVLEVGDTIRVTGGEETDFEQKVESMEVDHEPVKKAKKGDEIGLKLSQKARVGYKVYKLF